MNTPRQSIGLVAVTAAGRSIVNRIQQAWPDETRHVEAGSAAQALRIAFDRCDAVVAVLATGALIRILAPQIASGAKDRDPAVVSIDEAGRFVVPLLGGHAAGANELATRIAELLGATAALTTASDATGLPGLDSLGWPVTGDVAGVTRRMLDGQPVMLGCDDQWPLPALGPNVTVTTAEFASDIAISDRMGTQASVTLRPPSLIAGMGASRGAGVEEAYQLLLAALADSDLALGSVRAITTVDIKADEPGLISLAERLGVPLVTHSAEALGQVEVPNPSEVVRQVVGAPSVAEAAAILGTGGTALGDLIVPKRASAMVTVAIARHAPRGRLAVIGLGPGAPELRAPAAATELRRASVVVGLDQYVDQVRHLLRPGTQILASALGREEERAQTAVAKAAEGRAVALIGSGDAGVYAMASPALEAADESIDIVGIPGITAGLAAAAVLGAPLGHDHCYLSLSDLHTPWPVIERRARAVAEADLVLVAYNPRSGKRDWQLDRVVELLREHRPNETPVGVVRNASRADQRSWLTTIGTFDTSKVDMYSLVIIGSSTTRVVAGRMVTPRGYRWSS